MVNTMAFTIFESDSMLGKKQQQQQRGMKQKDKFTRVQFDNLILSSHQQNHHHQQQQQHQ